MASCRGNNANETSRALWGSNAGLLPERSYQECQRTRALGQDVLLLMVLELTGSKSQNNLAFYYFHLTWKSWHRRVLWSKSTYVSLLKMTFFSLKRKSCGLQYI